MNPILRAVLYVSLATLFFTFIDVIVKLIHSQFHLAQILFFSSFFSFPVIIYMILKHPRQWQEVKTFRPGSHVLRSMLSFTALWVYFLGLTYLPVSEATIIFFTSPIFATLLSIPLIQEKVGFHRWIAVLVGFFGTALVLNPGAIQSFWGGILICTSAIIAALSMVYARYLSRTESGLSMTFWGAIVGSIISFVIMLFVWETPTVYALAILIILGIVGGLGQFFEFTSIQLAPVSIIAPFHYLKILWALLLGWLIWEEFPTNMALLGAFIIVAAGIYIIYREVQISKKTSCNKA